MRSQMATSERAVHTAALDLRHRDGEGFYIRARGDELLGPTGEPGSVDLYLNCGALRWLTAADLGRLVAVHTRLRQAGGRLVLYNLRPELLEILSITRLHELFGVQQARNVAA